MATYGSAIADRTAKPIVIITIEGVGEYAGLWKFCNRVPAYTTSSLYKPWLADWPNILQSEIDPLGGIESASELSFKILDYQNQLTGKLRLETPAQTYITNAMTKTQPTAIVNSNTGITAGSTVGFIDGEAIRFDTLAGGTTWNVTRAHLGTEATTHSSKAALYLHNRHILNRRVLLYLAFDEASYSVGQETQIGDGWHIDSVSLDDNLNAWAFSAPSIMRYLDRTLLRHQYKTTIGASADGSYVIPVHVAQQTLKVHFGGNIFVQAGREILTIDALLHTGSPEHLLPVSRRILSTEPQEMRAGTDIKQVYVADTSTGHGSFRYQSPGAETASRASGTWIQTDHPVPILLAIMTSESAKATSITDGNVANNYTAGKGNYSGLPHGVGLGIPASRIDFDSFLDVWHRTSNFRVPHFYLHAQETARVLFEDNFFRSLGYELRIRNGKYYLDRFKAPATEETYPQWGNAEILTSRTTRGAASPKISARLDQSLVIHAVHFTLRTQLGDKVESTFTNHDFEDAIAASHGLFGFESKDLHLNANIFQADVYGAEPLELIQRAITILSRFRRPFWIVTLSTDLSRDTEHVGDIVELTHAQLVNTINGTRGLTAAPAKILSKKIIINPTTVAIEWTLLLYTQRTRAIRICPSGMIASVSGNTATLVANRYTDSRAITLPTTDAAAFNVGDVVRLRLRNGEVVIAPNQTIQAIGTNTITLDGNFGGSGNFSAGNVIEYAAHANATTDQQNRYGYMADEATRTIGTSSTAPRKYAEI